MVMLCAYIIGRRIAHIGGVHGCESRRKDRADSAAGALSGFGVLLVILNKRESPLKVPIYTFKRATDRAARVRSKANTAIKHHSHRTTTTTQRSLLRIWQFRRECGVECLLSATQNVSKATQTSWITPKANSPPYTQTVRCEARLTLLIANEMNNLMNIN